MSRVEASCFGKLPFQGDFIRHGPQGPELARLDQWLQEGLAAAQKRLGAGFNAAFAGAPTSRFLLAPRPGQRWLAGALTPGRDKVGRQYPLIVFAPLDPALVKGRPPAALPLLAAPLLDAADRLCREALALGALPDLYARVDACATTLDPAAADRALADALDRRTLADLFEPAFVKLGADALALANLADLAGPRARPKFALALPVGDPLALDVVFWLSAVSALRGPDAAPGAVAWAPRGAGPGQGLARLVLGDLTAEHASGVFLPGSAGKGLCELAQDGITQPDFVAKTRARAKALLADPRRPLRALAADVGKLGAS